MSHIVKYRNPDGKTDYHHTDDIHDAVSFVEQLRNDQGLDGAQIFRLEEVNFDYRPYYRVELKATDPMLASVAAKPAVAAAPKPVEPAVVAEPVVKEVVVPKDQQPNVVSVPAAPTPSVPPTPSAAPTAVPTPAQTPSTNDNSTVGARRGLFGR